ncbi:MAG: Primosomal protein [Armatimonadetes bacterium]|jgi:DNA-directed RNA polymerase subunit RPC12/RpoP|nr:Primosomal protein [Armatimonadota bacterium]
MSDPLVTGSSHSPDEIRKFPCKQCGAGLAFAPGQTVLQCPYCGYREEIPVTPEAIREYDLETALSQIPHSEGWGMERRSLHCENCGATTTFEPGQVAGECAFCGSKKVVEQRSTDQLIRPETLVPFVVKREQAVGLFRKWITGLWFRPNDLKHAGQLAKITGTYLPFWTYDAFASAYWTADAGYHYYVTENYTETDANGNTVQRTRQVQRTRWVPASGQRQDFFDDELVGASRGLPDNLLRAICPFQLEGLVPYQSTFLAGFVAEEYQVGLQEGWGRARARMEQEVEVRCGRDVPGDTFRNLSVNTAFSHTSFKHLLLPVWVAAYLYNGKSYRFLVNGQTGSTSGEAPLSAWKIAALVVAIIIVIAIVMFVLRARQGGAGAMSLETGMLWLRTLGAAAGLHA